MHFCPSCGYNLERDPVVESGLWRLDPIAGEAYHHNRKVRLSAQQFGILYACSAARGGLITRDMLMSRLGSDAETNTLSVQLSRIRNACREVGAAMPIETVWGKGLRWVWTQR